MDILFHVLQQDKLRQERIMAIQSIVMSDSGF